MEDTEMSRIEGILKGTYKGRPLSRIEALLMKNGAGSGSGGSSGGTDLGDYEDYEAIPISDLEKLFN